MKVQARRKTFPRQQVSNLYDHKWVNTELFVTGASSGARVMVEASEKGSSLKELLAKSSMLDCLCCTEL